VRRYLGNAHELAEVTACERSGNEQGSGGRAGAVDGAATILDEKSHPDGAKSWRSKTTPVASNRLATRLTITSTSARVFDGRVRFPERPTICRAMAILILDFMDRVYRVTARTLHSKGHPRKR